MAIEKDILDQLLAGRDLQEVFSLEGLVDELKKALSERILNTELDAHLGDEREEGRSNRRNGRSQKTVLTGTSKVTLDIPRDRAGTFDPKLIARYQRRFPDFDEKIVSMYARGMTVREVSHWNAIGPRDNGEPDTSKSSTGSTCRRTWFRRSPMPCSRRSANGRTGRSTPAIRRSSSMRSG